MATIKSYSDLQQSKKLAEILPLESANYTRLGKDEDNVLTRTYFESCSSELKEWVGENNIFPCWSLTTLLNILPYPQLSKDKLGSGKVGWMVSIYPDNCRYDSCWHDNPIDACYEMIIRLNELKML